MPDYFALIPAAGSSTRMAAAMPKQYLPLLGKPMLYHSISRLCQHPAIHRCYVVLAPEDELFGRYDWSEFADKLAPLYCGAETRAGSVLNGLTAAQHEIGDSDWILVHDGARPCLGKDQLDKLINELAADKVGGLLAMPVSDTVKRADTEARVLQTERRESLWLAQTPQMFRYKMLLEALQSVNATVATDEARAIESLGFNPKLVVGESLNLKVTYAQDLALAELILRARESQ
ncbi:MAG: 2-C-methyl-D-erythritol 4-phosphate cytidylyltransferase [Pseudomonadota bacterium]|nr:2-C-methyl-D-erythritol 4-phosphate cytidylyltransferase [Burkholderiales bacterium]MDQ3197056.1 2-C-methyl-D-erythritol 4-phosphate cytidylyltransferase [Pseudomonadota bacterium]